MEGRGKPVSGPGSPGEVAKFKERGAAAEKPTGSATRREGEGWRSEKATSPGKDWGIRGEGGLVKKGADVAGALELQRALTGNGLENGEEMKGRSKNGLRSRRKQHPVGCILGGGTGLGKIQLGKPNFILRAGRNTVLKGQGGRLPKRVYWKWYTMKRGGELVGVYCRV